MNSVVLLRAVQDAAGLTVNRKAQKIFINKPALVVNPSDRNALEAALQLGGEVTVVAFGPADPHDDLLRDALATGAKRAVRVDGLPADPAVQAAALAKLAETAEVVLCGETVLDGDFAQVAGRAAELLGRPLLAGAHRVTAEAGALNVIAAQGTAFHHLQADLPAVVMVAVHSNAPRYPNGAAVITAFTKKNVVEVFTPADLGLDDLLVSMERTGEVFPPERVLGKPVPLAQAVNLLAEQLR